MTPICHVCRGLFYRGQRLTLATPTQVWRPRVEWHFHPECLGAWLATATTTEHKEAGRAQERQAPASPVTQSA